MQNLELRNRAIDRFNKGERTKILTRNNMKIVKGQKKGYLTTGIHLSPADLVSKKSFCANASLGCKSACLNTSGQGALYMIRKEGRFKGHNTVQESRGLRSIMFEKDRRGFIYQLKHELNLFVAKAEREGLVPAVRLNLTSDLPWHRYGVMSEYPDVQFYDYTANIYNDELPPNYSLTFSKKEDNDSRVDEVIKRGYNVAVVFEKLPNEYKGLPVIDGDETDLRFLDNDGKQCIVGLKAKGDARKDESGFVVRNNGVTTLIDKLAA